MTLDRGAPESAADQAILADIRKLFEAADPVPAELRDRVRFAFDVAGADRELATLCEEMAAEAAIRGPGRAQTLTFGSAQMTICVSIGRPGGNAVRLDGWLDPPASMRVELTTGDLRLHAMSDENGRFVFDTARHAGEVQVAVHPTPGSTVELTRTVQTPPFPL